MAISYIHVEVIVPTYFRILLALSAVLVDADQYLKCLNESADANKQ